MHPSRQKKGGTESPMDEPKGTVPKTPPEADPRKENRITPARSEISLGPDDEQGR